MRISLFSWRRFAVLCAACLCSVCAAQVLEITNSTSVPVPGAGHDYLHLNSETVDPANGFASFRINVPMPPGRGLTFPFAFAYDSNGTHYTSASSVNGDGYMNLNGWSYSMPVVGMTRYRFPKPHSTGFCFDFANYTFRDPFARRYDLGLSTTENISGCGGAQHLTGGDIAFRASTASFATDASPVQVSDADGTTYTFVNSLSQTINNNALAFTTNFLATKIEDRNGNVISLKDLNGGAFTVTDTLGRTLLSSSGFGASGNTVSVSGLGAAYSLSWVGISWSFPTTGWTLLQSGTAGFCIQPGSPAGSGPAVS